MTTKELAEKAAILASRNPHGIVVIKTAGLCCDVEQVESIGWGFDWTQGKTVINTKNLLNSYSTNKISILKTMVLRTISNFNQVENGTAKTVDHWIARYRTRAEFCQRKSEAIIWLYEQLETELDQKIK